MQSIHIAYDANNPVHVERRVMAGKLDPNTLTKAQLVALVGHIKQKGGKPHGS